VLTSGATLAILTDGMGGYKGGEIASKLAVETFQKEFKPSSDISKSLNQSLQKANEAIYQYKEQHKDVASMGTTLIALYVIEDSFQWVSVGDSPLFLIRDNKIERINANHSVAGLLELQLKHGEITEQQAKENPNRHMLTSALDGNDLTIIETSKEMSLQSNDRLILASDGVETISMDEILGIVISSDNEEDISQKIIERVESRAKSNQDNATLVYIEINDVVSSDSDNIITNIEPKIEENKRIISTNISLKDTKLKEDRVMKESYLITFLQILTEPQKLSTPIRVARGVTIVLGMVLMIILLFKITGV
jgi:protein phosphatase